MTRSGSSLISAGFATTLIAVGVASFVPMRAAWGMNHLSYLSPLLGGIAWVLVMVSSTPFMRARLLRPAAAMERVFIDGRLSVVHRVLVAVAFTAICLALRSATPLWGDSEIMGTLADRAIESGSVAGAVESAVGRVPRSIGVAAIDAVFVRVGHAFGASPRSALVLLQALLGGLYVFVILGLISRLRLAPVTRAWISILFFTSGSIILFFGYLEVYALPYLVATMMAIIVHLYLDGDKPLWVLVVVTLVGAVLHALGLLLLPLLAYVLICKRVGTRFGERRIAMVVVLGTLAGMLCLLFNPFAAERFRPLFSAGNYRPVFSLWYLESVVNLIALLLPAFLVLVAVWWSARGEGAQRASAHGRQTLLSLVALAPFVFMMLLFKPDLGMTRDWDIFAILTPFIVMAFMPSLERARDALPAWTMPVLLLGLLQTGAWIGVHASAEASEARYRESLERDPSHAGYAYEIMAEYYESRGKRKAEYDLWVQARSVGGNPRYAFNAGVLAAELGRLDDAIEMMRLCLRSDPSHAPARANLASYLVAKRDYQGVIETTREGLKYAPDDVYYNVFLAMALVETKQYRDAQAQLRRCQSLSLPDDMRQDVARALVFVAGRLRE